MIFFFSGTGNSYAAAKQIADKIDGEQLVSLAGFNDFEQCRNEERIGLTFPCYGGRAPDIVRDFAEKLFEHVDSTNKYIFVVITYAHSAGAAYLDFTDKVSAWYKVLMPQNDIFNTHALSLEKENERLRKSVILINNFTDDILNKRATIMFRPFPAMHYVTKWAYHHVNKVHKSFGNGLFAAKNCIECKICAKCCPVNNISFDDGPVWGTECIHCCGCLNRCPTDAIQVANKTQGKRRYVHPLFKRTYYKTNY